MDVNRVPAALPGRRDGHRFTETFEALTQQLDACVVALPEQIHHLELRGRPRRHGHRITRRLGRLVLGPLRRVPGQHGAHRVEQDQQPPPSRIDHARPGEHVELLLGLLQGDRRRFGRRSDDRDEVRAIVRGVLGGPGRRLQHRDDGAGHGLAHRRDGQADPVSQGGAEHRRADVGEVAVALVGRLGGDVGEAAQDLRQDHPRVAAGPLQRALGQRGRHRHHVVVAARSRPARTPRA